MDIEEIKKGLQSGELILYNGKIFTKEEWAAIDGANKEAEFYDLLQHTKKIQL